MQIINGMWNLNHFGGILGLGPSNLWCNVAFVLVPGEQAHQLGNLHFLWWESCENSSLAGNP